MHSQTSARSQACHVNTLQDITFIGALYFFMGIVVTIYCLELSSKLGQGSNKSLEMGLSVELPSVTVMMPVFIPSGAQS